MLTYRKLLFLIFSYHSFCLSVELISIYDVLKTDKSIQYRKCHDPILFSYPEFPLALFPQWHPYSGMFAETFVATISQGRVCSRFGFVIVQNKVIKELLPQNYPVQTHVGLMNQASSCVKQLKKIPGRVAVITRVDTDCYGHWIGEVLGRLAMLDILGIEYDWIYTPYDKSYIKDTLTLWGVSPDKIIQPYDDTFYIQADELIVPSLTVYKVPVKKDPSFTGYAPCTMYDPNWNIEYIRNKFIPLAQQQVDITKLADKVFISRQDAGQRRMLNEDEVFKIFEEKGFKRYCLGKMTFLGQVALFNNAKIIVAAHGSGLTNVLFCRPDTKIIEIFQNQFDSTFWQLSQSVGLQHHCIKTQELVKGSWKVDTTVPVSIIQNWVDNNSSK